MVAVVAEVYRLQLADRATAMAPTCQLDTPKVKKVEVAHTRLKLNSTTRTRQRARTLSVLGPCRVRVRVRAVDFSSSPTMCADFVRVGSGPCRVRVVEFSFYSARGGGSLQARGLKGRSLSPKGREPRYDSRPPTRGFRAFKAHCSTFMAFK